MTRRGLLQAGAAGFASAAMQTAAAGPTEFQIACMTLPYAAFPFERALKGIASAGYRHVAWGLGYRVRTASRRPCWRTAPPPLPRGNWPRARAMPGWSR